MILALNDIVLLKEVPKKQRTIGGIHIPDSAVPERWGEVAFLPDGYDGVLRVGDKVSYKIAESMVELRGMKLLAVRHMNLLMCERENDYGYKEDEQSGEGREESQRH